MVFIGIQLEVNGFKSISLIPFLRKFARKRRPVVAHQNAAGRPIRRATGSRGAVHTGNGA